ncbi:MAG: YdcF family protein [Sphingomonadales bacterium]|nr:YdcF family protein [Sphingomonadales bacterium]MBD3773024.1 YdcF family protein [Paracoccaceae bacterium]
MLWLLGFLVFAVTLPGPAATVRTDAIIVPTGAGGRIERGLELLRAGKAEQMLVTGVDPEVKPREFAAQYKVKRGLMDCCITLGFAAVDTRGNAAEAAKWMDERDYRSLRLVTSDWHMRRARAELTRALPTNIAIVEDGVRSEPSLRILFLEYNKLLASWLAAIWPD